MPFIFWVTLFEFVLLTAIELAPVFELLTEFEFAAFWEQAKTKKAKKVRIKPSLKCFIDAPCIFRLQSKFNLENDSSQPIFIKSKIESNMVNSKNMNLVDYNFIREGGTGFYQQKRGLIEVSGKEAIQFLNGMITNDVAKLEDGSQMLAAFPNAQGRLLGVVRILRQGEKFLFETEEATYPEILKNLMRFTFAGDFYVEDLSETYNFFSMINRNGKMKNEGFLYFGKDVFVPNYIKPDFSDAVEISDELYEVLRIENGVPIYGIDMDSTTIIPELGLDGLISYNKGCYIGQEIIARIYFRGHIAKRFSGLVLEDDNVKPQDELKTLEGKNAGKITSVCYSPKLEKNIALGYVRYDYLADGTKLKVGETTAIVKDLPFLS